jgi:hypothetical protein
MISRAGRIPASRHEVLTYGVQNKLGGASYYEMAYEAVFRHISGLTPTASIRYALALHSTETSIHIF